MSYLTGVDPRIKLAEAIILADYSEAATVFNKKKLLRKFGGYPTLDSTTRTIANYGDATVAHETLLAANSIVQISSSASADTSIAVALEGHTYSAGNFTFTTRSTSTDASDGQTAVTFTGLARATRAYLSGDNVAAPSGTIYVTESIALSSGAPSGDWTKSHLTIPAGERQSRKTATTIEDGDYWIILEVFAAMLKKSSGFAEFSLEIKQPSGSWLPSFDFSATSNGPPTHLKLDTPVIVPANSDFRIVGSADTSAEVRAFAAGPLAEVA